ncbi:MAG: sigma-70 family RNA polymerase sigma factor [Bacteroidales bacterium]
MNPEDHKLKERIRAGDRHAFHLLFTSLWPGLVRYGTSVTRDEEAARELVQDLFLDLWTNRSNFKIKGSVRSYLFGATYYKSLNWLRHKKIRESYAASPVEVHRWLPSIEEVDPGDPLLADEINKAIRALPPRSREAFTRQVILGESQASVAKSLGVTVKTIENQVARARKTLQKKLKKF